MLRSSRAGFSGSWLSAAVAANPSIERTPQRRSAVAGFGHTERAVAVRSCRTLGATNTRITMPIRVAIPILLALAGCGQGRESIIPAAVAAHSPASSASAAVAGDLVLPLEVDLKVAESFVRIGYGLERTQRFQSTEFLTPRLRTSQAAPLIRLVETYNEFKGKEVANAVEALKGRVSGVEFGREGSPVVYIELPYWTHQREETLHAGSGTRISDEETERFIEELRATFVHHLKADEFSVRQRRVRIWWN
jgi:hypothetical protein